MKLYLPLLLIALPMVALADTRSDQKPASEQASQAIARSNEEIREESVSTLNELLRGEISAVETYRMAIEKEPSHPNAAKLKSFKADHEAAVKVLQGEIARLNGKPSTDSGAWGAWATAVQGTAKLFGNNVALKALREGEEHGLKSYIEALEKTELAASVKVTIRDNFIEKQREHIAALNSFISAEG